MLLELELQQANGKYIFSKREYGDFSGEEFVPFALHSLNLTYIRPIQFDHHLKRTGQPNHEALAFNMSHVAAMSMSNGITL